MSSLQMLSHAPIFACSYCDGPARLRCSGCGGNAKYCDEACQRAHWLEHKSDCRSLKESIGRICRGCRKKYTDERDEAMDWVSGHRDACLSFEKWAQKCSTLCARTTPGTPFADGRLLPQAWLAAQKALSFFPHLGDVPEYVTACKAQISTASSGLDSTASGAACLRQFVVEFGPFCTEPLALSSMMLRLASYITLQPSGIHGIGAFATKSIEAGDVLFELHSDDDGSNIAIYLFSCFAP